VTTHSEGRVLESPSRLRARGKPRLAVAYDITSSSPMELAGALSGRGEIVWVVDTSDPRLGTLRRLLPRLGRVVDVAGPVGPEAVEALRAEQLSGIIAFTDSQLGRASAIGQALGLVGNPASVVEALTDKLVQRRALGSAGIDGPGFVQLRAGVTGAEALALLDDLRFPIVVKPRRGSASRSVVTVADRGEVAGLFEARRVADRSGSEEQGGPWEAEDHIAEEWLDDAPSVLPGIGNYVSVEAVVQRGETVPLAITGKFPVADPCRETGNFMPHALDGATASAVLDLAVRAATALGVRSGALHIEIKLTPAGPRIIEVNGRVGGGGIDALYAARHGRSLIDIAVSVALGEELELDPEEVGRQMVPTDLSGPFHFEYFSQPPRDALRLVALQGVDQVLALPGMETASVNRAVGDEVNWAEGSQGYVASFRGQAEGLHQLSRRPADIQAALDVHFESENG
jgi:hypothetical protein